MMVVQADFPFFFNKQINVKTYILHTILHTMQDCLHWSKGQILCQIQSSPF